MDGHRLTTLEILTINIPYDISKSWHLLQQRYGAPECSLTQRSMALLCCTHTIVTLSTPTLIARCRPYSIDEIFLSQSWLQQTYPRKPFISSSPETRLWVVACSYKAGSAKGLQGQSPGDQRAETSSGIFVRSPDSHSRRRRSRTNHLCALNRLRTSSDSHC